MNEADNANGSGKVKTTAATQRLKELRKSPAQLRVLKLKRIAQLVFQFRWATSSEIRRVAQVVSRGLAEKLVREGILKKYKNGRWNFVYVLSAKGYEFLEQRYAQWQVENASRFNK